MIRPLTSHLTLVLLNPDLSFSENAVDPLMEPSDPGHLIRVHTVTTQVITGMWQVNRTKEHWKSVVH